MMSSMDAEAEMEGLFGGEDQGQDEAAATQSLTQEGQHVAAISWRISEQI